MGCRRRRQGTVLIHSKLDSSARRSIADTFHPGNIDFEFYPDINAVKQGYSPCMQDFRPIAPPSTARGASRPAQLAEVALKAKTAVDNGEQVLIFDDTTSQSIEVDFRGSAEEVLLRLAQTDGKETAAVCRRTARTRPSEAGRRRARDHAAAAALGLAQRPARWGFGRAPQTRGGGKAYERGQGSRPPIARGRLPVHVRHGRQPARFRGGNACLVCGSPRPLQPIDRAVAQGCSPARKKARRRRARRPHRRATGLLKS